MTFVSISIGAILGANLRYLVGGWVAAWVPTTFPLGTLVINVSGSFLLGLVLTLIGDHAPVWWRPGLAIGFLGSYTTFSTFCFETMRLARDGALLVAALNVGVSVAGACRGVYLGS